MVACPKFDQSDIRKKPGDQSSASDHTLRSSFSCVFSWSGAKPHRPTRLLAAERAAGLPRGSAALNTRAMAKLATSAMHTARSPGRRGDNVTPQSDHYNDAEGFAASAQRGLQGRCHHARPSLGAAFSSVAKKADKERTITHSSVDGPGRCVTHNHSQRRLPSLRPKKGKRKTTLPPIAERCSE